MNMEEEADVLSSQTGPVCSLGLAEKWRVEARFNSLIDQRKSEQQGASETLRPIFSVPHMRGQSQRVEILALLREHRLENLKGMSSL